MEDQPEHPSPFKDILQHMGISSDFAQRVRFRGPVGKLALIAVVCIVGFGGIGVRSSDTTVQVVSVIASLAIGLGFGAGILWYSTRYPDQATLEGMEVVVMHQQKAWAAKGLLPPAGNDLTTVIPDPEGSPPNPNPDQRAER